MFSTVGNHTLTATISDREGKSKVVSWNTSTQAPILTISGQYRPDGSTGVNFTYPSVTITIDKQNYPPGATFQTHNTTDDGTIGSGNGWGMVLTQQPNGGNPMGHGYYKYEVEVTDMWGQKEKWTATAGSW